jgi:hypothetical protein
VRQRDLSAALIELLADIWLPIQHSLLNLIRKGGQVQSQSIEQFPLRFISGEVSDQSAFRRILLRRTANSKRPACA